MILHALIVSKHCLSNFTQKVRVFFIFMQEIKKIIRTTAGNYQVQIHIHSFLAVHNHLWHDHAGVAAWYMYIVY